MPRCATERAHRTVEGECSLSRDVGSFSVFRGCVCVCHELSQMVTSLCPPTPASPPLANGAQRLRSVLGSLTGTPPPGDEVSERGFNSGSRADRESRERERADLLDRRDLFASGSRLARDRSARRPYKLTFSRRPTPDAPAHARRRTAMRRRRSDGRSRRCRTSGHAGRAGACSLGVANCRARSRFARAAHGATSRGSSARARDREYRERWRARGKRCLGVFVSGSSRARASGTTSS